MTWPTDLKPVWTVTRPGADPIAIADLDGAVARAQAPNGGGGAVQFVRHIHDGTGMGIVWQLIIFTAGLLPSVLAVTGIIMWWRARTRQVRQASGRASATA